MEDGEPGEQLGDETRRLENDTTDPRPANGEPEPLVEHGRRRRVRRLTWLLLLLLATVALLAGGSLGFLPQEPGRQAFRHPGSLPEAPPVVEASGVLAEVYEASRPATLRIESRCSNPLLRNMPIDVGSGFFVSPDGMVLTAYHVVRRQTLATRIRCALHYVAVDSQQREFRLELAGFDAFRDLALMRARVEEPVPYLELATKLPRVGSQVLAVGNSRGEFLADRSGSVTRLGVSAGRADFAADTIELTTALAPGDSGGPVIDEDGRVLGVVSYISYAPSVLSSEGDLPLSGLFGNSGPGYASYAVPTLAASEVVDDLLAGEQRDVPVIGFEVAFEYDPRVREAPALGRRPGVVVGRVQQDGPGARAGLRGLEEHTVRDSDGDPVGTRLTADVIVAVDGKATPTFDRLLAIVRERSVGDVVKLTVQRGGSTTELGLQLAAYRQIFR